MLIARYALGSEIHYGIQESPTTWRRLRGLPFERLEETGVMDESRQLRLLCPIDRPRIFGVGFNYAAHAKETGHPLPSRPAMFMKPDGCAIGPDEPIVYPLEHIFGVTCANDISERPIQFSEMESGCLLVGKGFDTFCPLGPVIATGLDHRQLKLSTRVNGQVRQSSNTSDLIFGVDELVSYISQAITLRPGDVIITGTPEGIGPLNIGDTVEIEIEGIGILRNPVIAESR
jgi:2-keto-4-pentenoate hydratase/2-oxohepta-3-ene-1,7-dioic acid hydratase in catechol pathway